MSSESGITNYSPEAFARSRRIEQDWKISISPSKLDMTAEELDPEHEGRLVLEYGFDALVKYYTYQVSPIRIVDPVTFEEDEG